MSSTFRARHAPHFSLFARRLVAAAAFAWLALGIAGDALAGGLRKVSPGETPVLGASEALLLVTIESPWGLDFVKVRGDFAGGETATLNVPMGGTTQLYVAPVGRYRWDEMRINGYDGYYRYDLRKNKELRFEVRAGQLNYPGTLVIRPYRARYPISVGNHGLAALDWLKANHAAVTKASTFAFTGHHADPFPAFYGELRERKPLAAGKSGDESAPLPAAATLPLPVEELWRDARIQDTALNGAGDLLAEAVVEKDKWGIDLIDLKNGTAIRLLDPPAPVSDLDWLSDRTLAVDLQLTNGSTFVSIVRIGETGGKRTFDVLEVPFTGFIVPGSEGERVVFASTSPQGNALLHRIDVSSQDALARTKRGYQDRLNKGLVDDVAWLVDGAGDVRLALTRDKDGNGTVMYGRAPDFAPVYTLDGDDEFHPYKLTPDGTRIVVVTDKDRDQRELVLFDPQQKKIAQTLFARPGVDVERPLFAADGTAIGVTYYRGGQLVSEYFDAQANQLGAQLQAAFPDRNVAVFHRDHAGRNVILGVDGSDMPPALFHFDRQAKQVSLVDEFAPWLGKRKFAPSKLVRATGSDGLPVEAFLTLPPGAGRHPLVVMPHGGPIGVADTRHFDGDVQMLAALGYAVLQVNFRGSDGYGRAYRDAGKAGFGTLIEEDVEAALKVALAQYPLDEKRMCTLGASYGGYSSLVAAIRWPGRYRCVVSMAGVTDRVLLLTASDTAQSERGRKLLVDAFGDPSRQGAAFLSTSPLYQFEKLDAPLLLVHGDIDERVDYEHTRRLVRVLNHADRPPRLLALENEGHGWTDKGREKVWPIVAAFLAEHLGTAAAKPAEAAKSP